MKASKAAEASPSKVNTPPPSHAKPNPLFITSSGVSSLHDDVRLAVRPAVAWQLAKTSLLQSCTGRLSEVTPDVVLSSHHDQAAPAPVSTALHMQTVATNAWLQVTSSKLSDADMSKFASPNALYSGKTAGSHAWDSVDLSESQAAAAEPAPTEDFYSPVISRRQSNA